MKIGEVNGTTGVYLAARITHTGCWSYEASGLFFYLFPNDNLFLVTSDLGGWVFHSCRPAACSSTSSPTTTSSSSPAIQVGGSSIHVGQRPVLLPLPHRQPLPRHQRSRWVGLPFLQGSGLFFYLFPNDNLFLVTSDLGGWVLHSYRPAACSSTSSPTTTSSSSPAIQVGGSSIHIGQRAVLLPLPQRQPLPRHQRSRWVGLPFLQGSGLFFYLFPNDNLFLVTSDLGGWVFHSCRPAACSSTSSPTTTSSSSPAIQVGGSSIHVGQRPVLLPLPQRQPLPRHQRSRWVGLPFLQGSGLFFYLFPNDNLFLVTSDLGGWVFHSCRPAACSSTSSPTTTSSSSPAIQVGGSSIHVGQRPVLLPLPQRQPLPRHQRSRWVGLPFMQASGLFLYLFPNDNLFLVTSDLGGWVFHSCRAARERERNVLFNDALNKFYLRLYGVRHMVKDHSDSEKGNRCHHIGYSYRLTSRVLLYAPSHRQDNTYHGLCYTSRGALACRGVRCSSVVRTFAHGAMGHRIDPSWGGPIELFLVAASAVTKAVVCVILSVGWCI